MTDSTAEVLIVEDDSAVARGLATAFRAAGYVPRIAGTGKQALELAALRPITVVLLDLGLPDLDGLGVLEGIRQFRPTTPIVVVSASQDVAGKVAALDAGADDYVTKPYDIAELLARVRVAQRGVVARSQPVAEICEFGDVVVDFVRRRVTRAGEAVHLSATEFRVLEVLARRPGHTVALDEILVAAWGPSYRGERAYVHTYCRRLRRKLERDPSNPQYLLSDRGHGYVLEVERVAAQHAPAQIGFVAEGV